MRLVYFLLLLLLFSSCSSLKKFKKCYPQDKFNALKYSLNKMDLAMINKYQSYNIISSYELFAKEYMSNASLMSVFSTIELLQIENYLNEFHVVNDSLIDYSKFRADYYSCLGKVKDKEVDEYLDVLQSRGEANITIVLGNIATINESKLSELEILILKTELLLYFLRNNK